MYTYKYPHPAVTTDCIVFAYDGAGLNVLLIERGGEPYKGCWAFPGGFLNIDECASDGARRELKEETGLTADHIVQFHTFSAPERDPRERVITVSYFTLVRMQSVAGGDDAARAQWFAVGDVPQLAFDHDVMLQIALERLREYVHFRPVGLGVLADRFTLDALRLFYEAVVGYRLEPESFAGEVLDLGLVVRGDDGADHSCGTDAPLYSFDAEMYRHYMQKGFMLVLRGLD